jgi:acetolactate synthase-1/2/3 large subunit
MIRSGATVLAEMLRGYGVSHVFFMPTVLLRTLAELEGTGVRRVMTHGEKAAAYMADGYARAALRPGVCFAQHIGSTNLLSGLRDAHMAGSPVIAFTGGSSGGAYRHAYQEVEDLTQFDTLTKFNAEVNEVARLPDLVRQAFREATSGATGPVHLRLRGKHGGVTEEPLEAETRTQATFSAVPALRPVADAASIEAAVQRLLRAKRPIIVVGGGAVYSGAHAEVRAFAEQLSIPVATSMNAKALLPDDHPLLVGVVGTYCRKSANQAVAEADLVFFVGSRAGGQVTHDWRLPAPDTPVIQLNIDPSELGRNYADTTPLCGDVREVMTRMIELTRDAGAGERQKWARRCAGLVGEWRAYIDERRRSDAVPVRPERICMEISEALPEDAMVVSDTGHAGLWTAACIELRRKGQRYIRAAGSLGWSFPAALGAKCALPDAPVVCFTGDGAFYYHIAELETAARYGINLVVVVNNNSALNQEVPMFDAAYGVKGNRQGSEMWEFRKTDFAKIAEQFGCVGIRVERAQDLAPALARAFAAGRPVVIDVVSDPLAYADKAWLPQA